MNLLVTDSNLKCARILRLARDIDPSVRWETITTGKFTLSFPRNNLGISPKTYELKLAIKKPKCLSKVLSRANRASTVYLVFDNDPAGETFSQWTAERIVDKFPNKIIKRLRLAEFTRDSLIEALHSGAGIDHSTVVSHETRLALDRILIFKLSQRFRFPIGRAILPTLQMIQDLKTDGTVHCVARVSGIDFWSSPVDPDRAKQLSDRLKEKPDLQFHRASFEQDIDPPLPFNTEDLICRASAGLKSKGSDIMGRAQRLYCMGLITDPVDAGRRIRPSLFKQAVEKIKNLASLDYCGYWIDRSGPLAVAPTDLSLGPSQLPLPPPMSQLYRAIWSRTLSSCSVPSKVLTETASFQFDGIEFKAQGSRLIRDGYRRVEVGFLSDPLVEIPKSLKFQESRADRRQDLTEAGLYQEAKSLSNIRTYLAVRSLESCRYIEFRDLNLEITPLGQSVLDQVRKTIPEILTPGFFNEAERRIQLVGQGIMTRVEMLDEYSKWLEERTCK